MKDSVVIWNQILAMPTHFKRQKKDAGVGDFNDEDGDNDGDDGDDDDDDDDDGDPAHS